MCRRICLCVLLCCSVEPADRIVRKQRIKTEATEQKSELGAPGRFGDVSSLGRHDEGCPQRAPDEQGRAENGADCSCSHGIPISQLRKLTLPTALSRRVGGKQQLSEYSHLPQCGPLIVGYKFVDARNFGRRCCSGLFAPSQLGSTGDFSHSWREGVVILSK